jgi:hypothetical protein
MLHHAGAASGVRIITVDRPGFGRSPYDPTHSLTCWPDRLGELADRLGVEKFSLLGAPCSSTCIPESLRSCTVFQFYSAARIKHRAD